MSELNRTKFIKIPAPVAVNSDALKAAQRLPKRHPQAVALDKWFDSEEGRIACQGTASSVYLHNRLRRAFAAGWNAAKEQSNDR